jgi:ribulose-phosphate 3-epimerase
VDRNEFFVEQMAELGAWMVSVHVESAVHLDRILTRIRDLGMKAGAALNPATPLSALDYVLDRIDFVLLMTVNPGYAGQRIVPFGLRKIAECRAWLDERGSTIPIQVDGNVSFKLIEEMTAAGADILVAGTSSVYHKGGTLAENMQRTRELAGMGLARRKTGQKMRDAKMQDAKM